MTFTDSIKTVFSKYTTITGRAQRSEYWWFVLFYVVVSMVLSLLGGSVADTFGLGDLLGLIFGLAIILPSICVTGRRLHDCDRSAWWILLVLIPALGGIILLIMNAMKGTDGPNRFGADPLHPAGRSPLPE